MPSVYQDGHMDMVGTIVGDKAISIDPDGVEEFDMAIGFKSSGPQTNGYTLIRKILETNEPPEEIMNDFLTPHSSFLQDVLELSNYCTITGMCHITGGGLTENLKRVIPKGLELPLDNNIVQYPEWCQWLQQTGNISNEEMYKVFNCGIGFIVFFRPKVTKAITTNGTYLGSVKSK